MTNAYPARTRSRVAHRILTGLVILYAGIIIGILLTYGLVVVREAITLG